MESQLFRNNNPCVRRTKKIEAAKRVRPCARRPRPRPRDRAAPAAPTSGAPGRRRRHARPEHRRQLLGEQGDDTGLFDEVLSDGIDPEVMMLMPGASTGVGGSTPSSRSPTPPPPRPRGRLRSAELDSHRSRSVHTTLGWRALVADDPGVAIRDASGRARRDDGRCDGGRRRGSRQWRRCGGRRGYLQRGERRR